MITVREGYYQAAHPIWSGILDQCSNIHQLMNQFAPSSREWQELMAVSKSLSAAADIIGESAKIASHESVFTDRDDEIENGWTEYDPGNAVDDQGGMSEVYGHEI